MQMDPRMLAERVEKALVELERVAADTPEQHVADLPRPHAVLDTLDALYGLIFRSSQGPDHYDYYIVDHICNTQIRQAPNALGIPELSKKTKFQR